jgi:hypothetical protein
VHAVPSPSCHAPAPGGPRGPRPGGGGRCADELKGSLRDTNANELTVPDRGITISGQEATARVVTELGEEDATDTVGLVQERGRWRIAEIGAPAS